MGKQWKQGETLCFWAPKSDGVYSHEIKKSLLLGRKAMTNVDSILKSKDITLPAKVHTNLGSILKSRDITFPTKVCLVKAMVFPVVIYGCESWTIKKAEH